MNPLLIMIQILIHRLIEIRSKLLPHRMLNGPHMVHILNAIMHRIRIQIIHALVHLL